MKRPEKELKKIFTGLGSVIFPKKDSITSECRLVVTATFMAYSVYIQAAEKIRASIFLFQLYNNWNITVGLIIYSHYRIEIKKFQLGKKCVAQKYFTRTRLSDFSCFVDKFYKTIIISADDLALTNYAHTYIQTFHCKVACS